MWNVFDYLAWRGDLSFSAVKLCEVDSVIFAMMSYIDYKSLCQGKRMKLCNAAVNYCADGKYDKVNLGLIMPSKHINKMFRYAASTKRYGDVVVSDFISKISKENVYQFCAVTYHIPGNRMVVTFRGTDDTIAGYREDCCLAFLDEIPAQRMSVEYLEAVAKKYPDKKIYVTGHSKGGNLALYSSVRCSDEVKARIVRAFCGDGPGLPHSVVDSPEYRKMQRKFTVLIPQSSFIGIMFEKGERYTVIKSEGKGPYQHDPFSWEVDGPAFIKLPELSKQGKKNSEQFSAGMSRMTREEKKEFVDTFFSLIESTGARTLSDFSAGGIRKIISLIKSYKGLDKETREMMLTLLFKLFDINIDLKNLGFKKAKK